MIRELIKEMLLHEKTLFDVLGKTPGRPKNLEKEPDEGGDYLYYPELTSTVEFRRDKKKMWNKYADHAYFQDPNKLFVFHYLGFYSMKDSLEEYFPKSSSIPGRVPGIDLPNKNELSCFGAPASLGRVNSIELFKWGGLNPRKGIPFFTFKKYRVTFASTKDASTERLSNATPADIERHKQSGLPKRPNTYYSYLDAPIDEEGVLKSNSLQEVVIDNWVIDTFYSKNEKDIEYAKELGLKWKRL